MNENVSPIKAAGRRNVVRSSALTIVAVFALVAACFFALQIKRAQDQKAAVAAILKTGGRVLYNGDTNYAVSGFKIHATFSTGMAPPGLPPSTFLRGLLGHDYFDRVPDVVLGPDRTSSALKSLRDLPDLKWVILEDTPVRDSDLRQLANLPKLKMVNVKRTQVTEEGIRELYPECEIQHSLDDE